ncbi:anti-sigma factor family protein [Denitrobaculum tricleocarpae]|uniref:Anti-sigma factor n=1 Tax=Denitrobaculum tricleocarpae TaxID=2591009 RepID=A0A545TP52_9PROT|nr:hypothetical protein [Denitrobaculum tricleocarpae]TQV78958.1 hypothetical protein FKG95_14825 [Denitrobaculum tricleocarpae]
MTSEVNSRPVTDEMLVAYVDGELTQNERTSLEAALEGNQELRARLALLQDGDRPWAEAFEGLLDQAPVAELEAAFAAAAHTHAEQIQANQARADHARADQARAELVQADPTETTDQVAAKDDAARSWWRPAMAACIAVTLMVGFAAGYGTNQVQKPDIMAAVQTEAEIWRQAVADYQALYTRETLSTAQTDPIAQSAGLLRVGEALGLALPDAVSQVAGLDYKRAQILKFGEQPLAQLAYLYQDDIPIAFCIVRLDEADQAATNEVRSGLNIVHWAKDGFSLMVVGDLPVEELNAFARELEGKMI